MAASTVHRVLVRNQMNRLSWMDRPTGRVIQRTNTPLRVIWSISTSKSWARSGWRAYGRGSDQHRATKRGPLVGYAFIHTAVDDHSRVAYSEILDDEKAATAVGFWRRARLWFDGHGVDIKAVLTDNGSCYRSHLWRDELAMSGVKHRRTRPYRP